MAYLGIDAGATWIKAGRFTDDLTIAKKVKVASGASLGLREYQASIHDAIAQVTDNTVTRVGIGLPGSINATDATVTHLINITGAQEASFPLTAFLPAFLGHNYSAYNDAACAAMGEWLQGHGQTDARARLLHVTWGTGIGTGVIVQSRPLSGWQGGHMPLTWNEQSSTSCKCGLNNDLEAFAAVPHIIAAVRSLQQAGKTTIVTSEDLANPQNASVAILTAAEKGDKVSQQVLEEAAAWLARGLQAMAVIAEPTVVTIGGGLMQSDWLLALLRTKVEENASGLQKAMLPPSMIQRAKCGNDAGIIGAAYLAQQDSQ